MVNIRRFIFFAEYLLIRIVGACFNLLPFSLVLRLARPLGLLLFQCLGPYRRIALENLRGAFGREKSEAEIIQIAKESFVYLAEFGAGWLRLPHFARHPNRYLKINGVERIGAALEKKKGAFLFLSHGGNWEAASLIGGWLIAKPLGTAIHALARPLRNPYLYHYVLHLRGLLGLRSISKIGAVREMFKCLNKNEIVCSLVDQRVGEGSVEVKFFGRPALTTSLPSIAALRLGTPLFFTSAHLTPDLRYVLEVEGPLPIDDTGDLERDVQTNTQKINDRIEAEIRKNPGHWLWMHNRWRIRHGVK